MCGIALLYHPHLAVAQREGLVQQAMQKIQHRGPDDSGSLSYEDVTLGHQRLSILDIANSQQPLTHPNHNTAIVFNGEIYNYQALRSTQLKDWNFFTQGDTESILAGLTLYGPDFVSQIHGMWAFAFWHPDENYILLSRDRIGKKPLFYSTTYNEASGEATLAISSEIPAILPLLQTTLSEDFKSTSDYFRYGYSAPGHTIYNEIKEVKPGHSLIWYPSGEYIEKPFWSLNTSSITKPSPSSYQDIKSKIIHAVEKRMVADVEVGAFLSGGIDSSLIVAIIKKDLGMPLKTFTIGFEDHNYDETHYAELVAQHYQTQHFTEMLSTPSPDHIQDLIVNHIGQPFADSSILPTFLVSQLAASHLKVVLSGDGADELFCGYQRYQAQLLFHWYKKLPRWIWSLLRQTAHQWPSSTSHHSRSLIKKAQLFINAFDRHLENASCFTPVFCDQMRLNKLLPDIACLHHTYPNTPNPIDNDDVHKMMLTDLLNYLPQDVLAKVDRATMANSLEARAPFMDTDVIDTAITFPRQAHRRFISGKHILKTCFNEYLPDTIWNRRKQGFASPVSQWFLKTLNRSLRDIMYQVDSPLNKEQVELFIQEHESQQHDWSAMLWAIYVYYIWRQHCL